MNILLNLTVTIVQKKPILIVCELSKDSDSESEAVD